MIITGYIPTNHGTGGYEGRVYSASLSELRIVVTKERIEEMNLEAA